MPTASPPPAVPACGPTETTSCTDNPTELCFFDPQCNEGSVSLGCDAGGRPGCRFCGFGAYKEIECPEGPPASGLSVETEQYYAVILVMSIASTIDTFDMEAFKAKLIAVIGGGISTDLVRVKVEAGSIKVTVTILSASADAHAAVRTSVKEKLADVVSASAALGTNVSSMGSIREDRIPMPASLPPWAVGLLIAGFTLGTAAIGCVVHRSRRAVGTPRKGVHVSMEPARMSARMPARLPAPRSLPEPRQNAENERQWEWSSAQVKWGTRLGNGTFGTVFIVESNGLRLAAKRVELIAEEKEKAVKLARREALAMRSLSHPNVVNLLGVVLDNPSFIALLMELADCGSLRDVLDVQRSLVLAHPDVQAQLAVQIAEGMAYLHSRETPLLHHDLKSANVLIFSESGNLSGPAQLNRDALIRSCAKLCDFGLATGLSTSSSALQSTRRDENAAGGVHGGTWAYMAPETFDEDYTAASEVYAFAIVLWEVLTGGLPWSINPITSKPYTLAQLVRAVGKGDRLPLPPESDGPPITMLLRSLVERCWLGDARARPSFGQVVVQLRLAQRQQSGQVEHGVAEEGSSSFEQGDGKVASVGDEASGADNQKLMYTMRHSVHRSHRADGYNEAYKSFGPTARRQQATSTVQCAATAGAAITAGGASQSATESPNAAGAHDDPTSVSQALLLGSVQSALGISGNEGSTDSACDPTLDSFARHLQSAAQCALREAPSQASRPPPRLASGSRLTASKANGVAYV